MLTNRSNNKIKYYIFFFILTLIFLGIGITLFVVHKPDYDHCMELDRGCDKICGPINCVNCSPCNVTCSQCSQCSTYNNTFCSQQICPTIGNCLSCREYYISEDCNRIRQNYGSYTVLLGLGIVITSLFVMAVMGKVCRT